MKGEIVPSREVETNNSLGQSTKQNSIPFYSCHLTGTWACCRKIRHKKCELSTVCMCACACTHVCVSQQLFTRIFFHILYISTKKKKKVLQSYPSPLPYPHTQKLVISFNTLPFIVHSQCHSKRINKTAR